MKGEPVDIEAFVRDKAAHGFSRRATRAAVGMSYCKFQLILEALPDIKWPGPAESVDALASFEAREGVTTPAQRKALERAWASSRLRHCVTVRGVTGTVPELIRHFELTITASHVQRRRKRYGMTLEAALFTPPTPRAERNRKPSKDKTKAAPSEPLSAWERVDIEFAGRDAPMCM
jgi:hypothetical protein